MLHPFMPCITEELWHGQGQRPYELIVASWPQPQTSVDAEAKPEVEWLIGLTSALRTAKNELGIAPGARLEAFLTAPSQATRGIIERNPCSIDRLARLNGIRSNGRASCGERVLPYVSISGVPESIQNKT